MGYSYNRVRAFQGYRKGTGWDEVPVAPLREFVKQVRVDAAGRCEWEPNRAAEMREHGYAASTILQRMQEKHPGVEFVIRNIPETVWS